MLPPYFQDTDVYFIAGRSLDPKFSRIMGSTEKLSAIQKTRGKQGGVGARTQDHRVRRANMQQLSQVP